MTLVEDLVGAPRVVVPVEEVVVAHLVERGGGGVGRDVPADGDPWTLGAVHRDGRVPAQPGPVATLDLFVARELRLVLGRDRVDVVGRRDHGDAELQLLGALEEAQHDLPGAFAALRGGDGVERLLPFGGLVGVGVDVVHRVGVLVVDCHG